MLFSPYGNKKSHTGCLTGVASLPLNVCRCAAAGQPAAITSAESPEMLQRKKQANCLTYCSEKRIFRSVKSNRTDMHCNGVEISSDDTRWCVVKSGLNGSD
jgi:hypothetical protein